MLVNMSEYRMIGRRLFRVKGLFLMKNDIMTNIYGDGKFRKKHATYWPVYRDDVFLMQLVLLGEHNYHTHK